MNKRVNEDIAPPRLADRFLKRFCREELLEEVKGDLHEFYRRERADKNRWLVNIAYWYHMINFLRPFALKKKKSKNLSIMPFVHFKIAFRRLSKNKLHSLINVFGLALGLTAFTLILLFVRDELSYDNFHEKPEQVVRLGVDLNVGGQLYNEAGIQFPAATALKAEYPEVEQAIRIYKTGNYPLIQKGDVKYIEDKLFFVDADFFEVFGYQLSQGNINTALSEPGSIILSEATAAKYFGEENPMGQTLNYQGEIPLKVTGVVRTEGLKSHMNFDFLVPMAFQLNQWQQATGLEGRENKWFWTGAWTYLRLNEQASPQAMLEKLPEFMDKYFPDRYKEGSEFVVQPIRDIHLESKRNNEMESNGDVTYVIIFGAVALAVLFIACINFINLNTIQALNRVKEIGTRKALGAGKSHLINLILGESFLITLLAAVTSLVLSLWLISPFNALTDKAFTFQHLLEPQNLTIMLGIVLVIAVLSGIYPAQIVARYGTAEILKGTTKYGGSSSMLRKILVTVQFVASVGLIISIMVINNQLNYLNEKEIGYDQENLLVISGRSGVSQQYRAFKEELLKHPGIKNVTAATNIPGYGMGGFRFVPEGGSRNTPITLPLLTTGLDYIETMQIDMIEGHDFDAGSPRDLNQGFLLNRKAVTALGWEEDPIGKKLEFFGPGVSTIAKSGYVIGVIDDFHFESLHHDIRPLVITYGPFYYFYTLRTTTDQLADVLEHAESVWGNFEEDWPMDYFLLEDELQQLYSNERKLSKTIFYFTVIAVLIACVGLYALGSFLVMSRVKEVGIRRVLGASFAQIFNLLHKDFVRLILIANVIAWPLTFLFARDWLRNFAYSTRIDPIYFLIGGLISFLLVILTTGYHVRKAHRLEISRLLRDE